MRDLIPQPVRLESIEVYASGHGYRARITNVAIVGAERWSHWPMRKGCGMTDDPRIGPAYGIAIWQRATRRSRSTRLVVTRCGQTATCSVPGDRRGAGRRRRGDGEGILAAIDEIASGVARAGAADREYRTATSIMSAAVAELRAALGPVPVVMHPDDIEFVEGNGPDAARLHGAPYVPVLPDRLCARVTRSPGAIAPCV